MLIFIETDRSGAQKKALNTHRNVTHLGKRDFVCPDCNKTFGYKHLLQRHNAKVHIQPSPDGEASTPAEVADSENECQTHEEHIDQITGKAYSDRRKANPRSSAYPCPYPGVSALLDGELELSSLSGGASCDRHFSRLYDLNRHLEAEHDVRVSKDRLQIFFDQRTR